jgi:hypothetical protein
MSIFIPTIRKELSNQQLMGGIYSLNEQETTNYPPVVSGCVII